MRFITEFEIIPPYTKAGLDSHKGYGNMQLGACITESFGWTERVEMPIMGPAKEYYTAEIEAFPMDKWVEFKKKLFIATCIPRKTSGEILELIKELESFGKPSGDAITNLSDQMEYRGPSSHCKACEDEKNGVKHIMAQKHTCRK